RQPRGAGVRTHRADRPGRRGRRHREGGGGPVSDAPTRADSAMTAMEFHPQPKGGAPRPWAFPAPERSQLPNGLTLLTSHRPGQQVVAVEINLLAPLEAEPEGLDGISTIMARALSEGTDKHDA